jgi:hypothetical protein
MAHAALFVLLLDLEASLIRIPDHASRRYQQLAGLSGGSPFWAVRKSLHQRHEFDLGCGR